MKRRRTKTPMLKLSVNSGERWADALARSLKPEQVGQTVSVAVDQKHRKVFLVKTCEGCRIMYWTMKEDQKRFCGGSCAQQGERSHTYKHGLTSKRNGRHKDWFKSQFQKHSKKFRARWILHRNVRNGVVKKKPCSVCGEIKSQGHHEDYSKPLEVIWLCDKHHKEAHSKKV